MFLAAAFCAHAAGAVRPAVIPTAAIHSSALRALNMTVSPLLVRRTSRPPTSEREIQIEREPGDLVAEPGLLVPIIVLLDVDALLVDPGGDAEVPGVVPVQPDGVLGDASTQVECIDVESPDVHLDHQLLVERPVDLQPELRH